MFKFFGSQELDVLFTCWHEHEQNNYCPIEWKGKVLKKAYLNLETGNVCILYKHPIKFCPDCGLPNKITWIEVEVE